MSSRRLPVVLTVEAEDVLDSLALFPEMGRRDHRLSGNARTISVGSHVIVYRGEDDTVHILRIVHGRMDISRHDVP